MYLLDDTLSALQQGQMIVFPTDTVWGIGCDATDREAVAKVLAFKERSVGQGLVCLVDSIEMLVEYTGGLHPRLQTVLELNTRPLTMVYPDARNLADNVLAADGSAALRIPLDAYCKNLIKRFGKPIVATSANRRGEPFPAHFGEISSEVLTAADHVVRYRQRDSTPGLPSVVARWTENNEIQPIRE